MYKWMFMFCISVLFLESCIYKMPTSDSICTVPNANNPMLTREKPTSWMPEQG